MKNYISVYKLQEETYLYRCGRGGETGAKLLGVSVRFIFTSSEDRCLYVPFVSLYKQCVLVRVLASPVCLSSCCNPSLCVGSPPLRCLSVCLYAFTFCLSVCACDRAPFHLSSTILFICVLFLIPACCLSAASELDEAQACRRARGCFFGAPSKWRHFAFHLPLSVSPNPPVWTFSPSSLTNQSINQNQVSL